MTNLESTEFTNRKHGTHDGGGGEGGESLIKLVYGGVGMDGQIQTPKYGSIIRSVFPKL